MPTDHKAEIYFDGSCGLCTRSRQRFGAMTARRGFIWLPLQTPAVAKRLGLSDGELPGELKLLTHQGEILGGVDALMYIARRIWWATPVWLVSLVPGVRPLMRVIYRQVARNRHRISGACGFDPTQR
jgi:predicted DCC family thiol-disulfide oxidoreductase YuxK